MIPSFRPVLGIREALAAFTPGRTNDVEEFENIFAEFVGQKHALAFPYGRTGLTILLEAMGLKGREVICPAYTCAVIPDAILKSGNEPLFVDSKLPGFNMDLDAVSGTMTPKTAALVATSLFGYPVDLDILGTLRKAHPGLLVIQDCAHSFLAQWRGRPVHKAGDAAIFSFNIGKTIHAISGGMITTDRDDLAQALREVWAQKLIKATSVRVWRKRTYLAALYPAFWNYSLTHALGRMGFLDRWTENPDGKTIEMPKDFLETLTSVEARVGRVQLESYEGVVNQRQADAAFYNEQLMGINGFDVPPLFDGATYSHFVATTDRREVLFKYGLSRGIRFGDLFDYSVPETEVYRNRSGSQGAFPVARRLSQTMINLPCGSGRQAQEKTVSVIRQFFEEKV